MHNFAHLFSAKHVFFMTKQSPKMNFQVGDPEENRNLALEPDMQLPMADLSARLRAGWRAEADYDRK